MLAAVAFEHASRAPILGIEHFPKELGLLAAMAARRDRVGFEAGKNFVFKFVIHNGLAVRGGLPSYEVNIRSIMMDQPRVCGMERFVSGNYGFRLSG